MNQTTRNAPFGTDDTPSMTVKIVGGKRVQIAVDSRKNQGNGSRTHNDNILTAGPTGTPAILTQPNWEAYDAPTPNVTGPGRSIGLIGQSDQTRKVSSYTSPTGDRSYSFKHGLPAHNPRVRLPPYTSKSTDPFLPPRGNSNQIDGNSETITLAAQIGYQLRNYSLQNLKDMYIDLTTFDRRLTGMVGEAQFSVIALRHNMPLKLSLLKLVFAKFLDVRDPSMINYEKILQYFSDCIADGPMLEPDTHNDDNKQRSISVTQSSVPNNNAPAPDITSRNDNSKFRSEDDILIELILAQLATDEVLELNGLKSSLQGLDRSGTNILSADAIQSTCMKSHLPLPMSLLLKLLRRAETTSGKANWVQFMEPLERANEVKLHNLRADKQEAKRGTSITTNVKKQSVSASKNGRPSLVSDSGPSLVSSWKQNLLERPTQSAFSEMSRARSEFGAYSGLPSPPSTTSTLERELSQLPYGWDEKERLKDISSTPLKMDSFSDKMNKLEEMLRSYNPSSEDILMTDDAERITKNFNLIYKLGLSEKEIADALSKSVLPNKGSSGQDTLSVSKLLTRLNADRKNSS